MDRGRYKNPKVYTFRTNTNILSCLAIMALAERRYKNEIIETAIAEYWEKNYYSREKNKKRGVF